MGRLNILSFGEDVGLKGPQFVFDHHRKKQNHVSWAPSQSDHQSN
jgi:hypothetical protein